MTGVAPSVAVAACVIVEHLAHQSQHAPYNVPYDDLPWLRCCEPSADLAYALHELRCVSAFELAHDAEHERCRSNGAWSGIADLSSFEEAAGCELSITPEEGAVTVTDDMRCSTEGSAGVVLSDLRKDMSPGASGAMPCAMIATARAARWWVQSRCVRGLNGGLWCSCLCWGASALWAGCNWRLSSARRVRKQA